MCLYKVEELINTLWITHWSLTSSKDECINFIKREQSHYPVKTFRIVETHEEVGEIFNGIANAKPKNKIIHCDCCDKVLTHGVDNYYKYTS